MMMVWLPTMPNNASARGTARRPSLGLLRKLGNDLSEYEIPHVCQSLESSRASRDRSWTALIRCLQPAAEPDPACIESRATPQRNRLQLGLRDPDRAQCDPRF